MAPGPVHRALAAFDIEKSGDPGKTDDIQRATRLALRSILREAVDGASIGWSRCTWLDRGDGGVLVAPGETQSRVVDPLAGHLAAALRRHNRRSSELARIRLRTAVHAGPVHDDPDGVTGATMVHLARLLDAQPLREHLAVTSADLAMLVSDSLYDQIVRHDYGLMDPASFHPVDVQVKETHTRGWLLASGGAPVPPAPRSGGSHVGDAAGWPADRPGSSPGGMHVSIGSVYGPAVLGPGADLDSLVGRDPAQRDPRHRREQAEPR
jgi:hypothetical protein